MQFLPANGLPSAVNRFIAERPAYANKALTILTFPIWSTIRFQFALTAGPPVVIACDTSPRTAFSYGLNGDMGPAGRAGVLATQADTNLQNPGQTRDQADVFIYGISAYIGQQSEPALVADIVRETDVQISTNGNVTLPLGSIDMFPAPGGIFGGGSSALLEPSIDNAGGVDGGAGTPVQFFSNGNPTSGSFFKLDAPIFWAGVGSGPDSNLALICTPRRTITKTSALARAAGAAAAAYNGAPSAFTPITAARSFVDVRWRLHAASVQARSANV